MMDENREIPIDASGDTTRSTEHWEIVDWLTILEMILDDHELLLGLVVCFCRIWILMYEWLILVTTVV